MKNGALIGCGFFAQNHMHAWSDIEAANITALCDKDEEKLRTTADRFGITKTYTDVEDLLSGEQLDFVDVATTVQSHRSLVERSAAAGVHIICQKPFAETMEDAQSMIDAAAQAGVSLMVHENFRWQSAIRTAKSILQAGQIGIPFWGRVSFRSAYDVYSGQPYLATDDRFIIQDLGIHILDIARFLFGDVQTLTASTCRVNPAIRAEDVASIMLVHDSGVTSFVDCSYATHLPRENFPESLLEIDGSKGTIRLLPGYRIVVHTAENTQEIDASPPVLPWAERPWHNIQESVLNIQQHFIDCITKNQTPETSGADNLNTLELVEMAYRSTSQGSKSLCRSGGL